MSVRLLFQVTEKKEIINQSGGSEKMGSVTLYPKYPAPDAPNYEEQASFYKWTPSGKIEFATINESALASLELGKSYYVTIQPVPELAAEPATAEG